MVAELSYGTVGALDAIQLSVGGDVNTATLALSLALLGHPDRSPADRASATILASTILRAAQVHGIDPIILAALAAHESAGFNRHKVGRLGERGVFQILPATAHHLGYIGSDEALANNPINAMLAAEWLARVRGVCRRHGKTSDASILNAYRGAGCSERGRYARSILAAANAARAPIKTPTTVATTKANGVHARAD